MVNNPKYCRRNWRSSSSVIVWCPWDNRITKTVNRSASPEDTQQLTQSCQLFYFCLWWAPSWLKMCYAETGRKFPYNLIALMVIHLLKCRLGADSQKIHREAWALRNSNSSSGRQITQKAASLKICYSESLSSDSWMEMFECCVCKFVRYKFERCVCKSVEYELEVLQLQL